MTVKLTYTGFTKRHLPHFQPFEATLFVTFRLAGSIPRSTVRYYQTKRQSLRDQLRRCERMVAEDTSYHRVKCLKEIEHLHREWFIKSEDIMHRQLVGPTWLREEPIAATVATSLHQLDNSVYRLDCFSIMSNHVHTVFRPLVDQSVIEQILRSSERAYDRIPALAKIMQAIKGRSARECNLLLGRCGQFWEHESFDHVIRTGKYHQTIRYVLNNPVKAGMVRRWQDYKWNYCRKELVERFRSLQ